MDTVGRDEELREARLAAFDAEVFPGQRVDHCGFYIAFHQLATRFGHLVFEGDRVGEFSEKPQTAEGWINGAYFVLEPEVFDYIEGDDTQWEREPMERLARDGQLFAYRHDGFWQCMDTLRDKRLLQEMWDRGDARWAA